MSDENTENSAEKPSGNDKPHKVDYAQFLAVFKNVHTRRYLGLPLTKRISNYSVVSFAARPEEMRKNDPKHLAMSNVYAGVRHGKGFVEAGTPIRLLKVHGDFDPSYENMVIDYVKKKRIMEEYPDTSGVWESIKDIPDIQITPEKLILASDLLRRLNKRFKTRSYIALGQNLFSHHMMFMCAGTAHNLGMNKVKMNLNLPGCPVVFYNDNEDYLLCMPRTTGDMYRSNWTEAFHCLTIYEPLTRVLYGTSINRIFRYLKLSWSWNGDFIIPPPRLKPYYDMLAERRAARKRERDNSIANANMEQDKPSSGDAQ